MNFLWQILVVITGLLGAVTNIYKKKICFVIWTIHQIGWIVLAVANETYIVIASPVFYIGLNIFGWLKWRNDECKGKK